MKTVCLVVLVIALVTPLSLARLEHQAAEQPAAIDPQRVQDQDTMTWDDYRPFPGRNGPTRR